MDVSAPHVHPCCNLISPQTSSSHAMPTVFNPVGLFLNLNIVYCAVRRAVCQVKTLPAASALCFLSRRADPHSAPGYYSGDQGHFHYVHICAKVPARHFESAVEPRICYLCSFNCLLFHFTRQVQALCCRCTALHQPNKWNLSKIRL